MKYKFLFVVTIIASLKLSASTVAVVSESDSKNNPSPGDNCYKSIRIYSSDSQGKLQESFKVDCGRQEPCIAALENTSIFMAFNSNGKDPTCELKQYNIKDNKTTDFMKIPGILNNARMGYFGKPDGFNPLQITGETIWITINRKERTYAENFVNISYLLAIDIKSKKIKFQSALSDFKLTPEFYALNTDECLINEYIPTSGYNDDTEYISKITFLNISNQTGKTFALPAARYKAYKNILFSPDQSFQFSDKLMLREMYTSQLNSRQVELLNVGNIGYICYLSKDRKFFGLTNPLLPAQNTTIKLPEICPKMSSIKNSLFTISESGNILKLDPVEKKFTAQGNITEKLIEITDFIYIN